MAGIRQRYLFSMGDWMHVKDGNPVAYAMHTRHYSHRGYSDGRRDDESNSARRLIVGPGEKMVLLTPDEDALFAWRRCSFRNDRQDGVECTVFRNEGKRRSSELILSAEKEAFRRWPGERMFTYVDSRRVRSTNPGCCFKAVGWRRCGESQKGLLILEKT